MLSKPNNISRQSANLAYVGKLFSEQLKIFIWIFPLFWKRILFKIQLRSNGKKMVAHFTPIQWSVPLYKGSAEHTHFDTE